MTESGRETEDDYEYSRLYTETRNAIHDVSADASMACFPSEQISLRIGAQYTHHSFSPENEVRESTLLPDGSLRDGNNLSAHEWNAYLEGNLKVFSWLNLNAGLRGSFFRVEGKQYHELEPRVSTNFRLSQSVSLKAGYARMSQFVQQVSDNYISLPTDYWLPVTQNFSPLTSDQISAGIYFSPDKRFTFSLEGYYKQMDNLLEYRDNYRNMVFASWEEKLASGTGRAYGIDF